MTALVNYKEMLVLLSVSCKNGPCGMHVYIITQYMFPWEFQRANEAIAQ